LPLYTGGGEEDTPPGIKGIGEEGDVSFNDLYTPLNLEEQWPLLEI